MSQPIRALYFIIWWLRYSKFDHQFSSFFLSVISYGIRTRAFTIIKIWKYHTRPLFRFIFGVFQKNITIIQQYHVKKSPSCLQCWYSNPQLLERDSPLIATRPGLPPMIPRDYRSFSRNKTKSWSIFGPFLNDLVELVLWAMSSGRPSFLSLISFSCLSGPSRTHYCNAWASMINIRGARTNERKHARTLHATAQKRLSLGSVSFRWPNGFSKRFTKNRSWVPIQTL